MYDRQTDTLWSHVLGRAVAGPLKGAELEMVPLTHTTWKAWRDSQVGQVAVLTVRDAKGRDNYQAYYESKKTGIIPRAVVDERLDGKARILGVMAPGLAKAYALDDLRREKVIHDNLGKHQLVIVYDEVGDSGVAFATTSKTERFRLENTQLVDSTTQSLWSPLSGVCVSGPRQGEELERADQTLAFWFGWLDHFPQTQLWGH